VNRQAISLTKRKAKQAARPGGTGLRDQFERRKLARQQGYCKYLTLLRKKIEEFTVRGNGKNVFRKHEFEGQNPEEKGREKGVDFNSRRDLWRKRRETVEKKKKQLTSKKSAEERLQNEKKKFSGRRRKKKKGKSRNERG